MSIPLVLLIAVLCTALSIIILFHFQNKKYKNYHEFRVLAVQNECEQHLIQIEKRDKNLKSYDFLKYNLKEALVPQHEIKL